MDDLKIKAKEELFEIIKKEFLNVEDEYISVLAEQAMSLQWDFDKIYTQRYIPNIGIKVKDIEHLKSSIVYEECSELVNDDLIFKTIYNMEKHNEN